MSLDILEDKSFILSFLNFGGGLNTRDLDTVIRDDELSDIANFNFDKRSALKIRKGFKKYGSTALGAFAVRSIEGYYRTGSDVEVIATGSTIISRVTSTSKTDIRSGLTGNGLVFDLHQFMGHFYMANGTDPVQVYNGTSVWNLGYPIPTSVISLAKDATAGGLEAKVYRYKYTFYYADGESNPCAAEYLITPDVGRSVAITNIPAIGGRITQIRIYRTTGNGLIYRLLTTITTTSFIDSIPDSGLGANMDNDNNIPPAFKYVINHKGRLWGMTANSSRIHYSKALHPESFPPLYFWDAGKNDGTIGTALAINLGILVILKNYSTWIIKGNTPVGTAPDMSLINVNPRIGCISAKTIAHAGNDLLFLSPNLGVQRLHRVILAATETMDVEALSDKIDSTIKGLASRHLQHATAEIFDHKYHLFVPDGASQTSNNIALVLDLRNIVPNNESTIRWTKYTNMNFAACSLIYDAGGDRLLTGTNMATGHIFDFGVHTTDDGVRIEAYAFTKNHDIGDFARDKTLRSIISYGKASEDWGFNIRLFTNNRGIINQTVYNFTTGIFVQGQNVLWDSFLFDKFMWDSNPGYSNVVVDFMKPRLLTRNNTKLNLLKIKIENVNANQDFLLYGVTVKGFLGNQYLYD